jgi:hypothetical protein
MEATASKFKGGINLQGKIKSSKIKRGLSPLSLPLPSTQEYKKYNKPYITLSMIISSPKHNHT